VKSLVAATKRCGGTTSDFARTEPTKATRELSVGRETREHFEEKERREIRPMGARPTGDRNTAEATTY
jgi:hypothetical protein